MDTAGAMPPGAISSKNSADRQSASLSQPSGQSAASFQEAQAFLSQHSQPACAGMPFQSQSAAAQSTHAIKYAATRSSNQRLGSHAGSAFKTFTSPGVVLRQVDDTFPQESRPPGLSTGTWTQPAGRAEPGSQQYRGLESLLSAAAQLQANTSSAASAEADLAISPLHTGTLHAGGPDCWPDSHPHQHDGRSSIMQISQPNVNTATSLQPDSATVEGQKERAIIRPDSASGISQAETAKVDGSEALAQVCPPDRSFLTSCPVRSAFKRWHLQDSCSPDSSQTVHLSSQHDTSEQQPAASALVASRLSRHGVPDASGQKTSSGQEVTQQGSHQPCRLQIVSVADVSPSSSIGSSEILLTSLTQPVLSRPSVTSIREDRPAPSEDLQIRQRSRPGPEHRDISAQHGSCDLQHGPQKAQPVHMAQDAQHVNTSPSSIHMHSFDHRPASVAEILRSSQAAMPQEAAVGPERLQPAGQILPSPDLSKPCQVSAAALAIRPAGETSHDAVERPSPDVQARGICAEGSSIRLHEAVCSDPPSAGTPVPGLMPRNACLYADWSPACAAHHAIGSMHQARDPLPVLPGLWSCTAPIIQQVCSPAPSNDSSEPPLHLDQSEEDARQASLRAIPQGSRTQVASESVIALQQPLVSLPLAQAHGMSTSQDQRSADLGIERQHLPHSLPLAQAYGVSGPHARRSTPEPYSHKPYSCEPCSEAAQPTAAPDLLRLPPYLHSQPGPSMSRPRPFGTASPANVTNPQQPSNEAMKQPASHLLRAASHATVSYPQQASNEALKQPTFHPLQAASHAIRSPPPQQACSPAPHQAASRPVWTASPAIVTNPQQASNEALKQPASHLLRAASHATVSYPQQAFTEALRQPAFHSVGTASHATGLPPPQQALNQAASHPSGTASHAAILQPHQQACNGALNQAASHPVGTASHAAVLQLHQQTRNEVLKQPVSPPSRTASHAAVLQQQACSGAFDQPASHASAAPSASMQLQAIRHQALTAPVATPQDDFSLRELPTTQACSLEHFTSAAPSEHHPSRSAELLPALQLHGDSGMRQCPLPSSGPQQMSAAPNGPKESVMPSLGARNADQSSKRSTSLLPTGCTDADEYCADPDAMQATDKCGRQVKSQRTSLAQITAAANRISPPPENKPQPQVRPRVWLNTSEDHM